MKKILTAFACMTIVAAAHGYEICGPDVATAAGYAASDVYSATDLALGYWAVGDGCTASTTTYNVNELCTTVIAGGEAFCSGQYYGAKRFDETTASYGTFCWCRRTKMRAGNKTVDSVGQWVLIGGVPKCQQNCAAYCATNVISNTEGMRNAIMVLPSY